MLFGLPRKVWHRKRSLNSLSAQYPRRADLLLYLSARRRGDVVCESSVIGAFTMITTVSAILFMFSGRLSFARTWCIANSVLICIEVDLQDATRQADVLGMYGVLVFVLVLLTLEDDTRQALLVPRCGLSRWGWAGCLLVKNACEVMPRL